MGYKIFSSLERAKECYKGMREKVFINETENIKKNVNANNTKNKVDRG